MLPHSWDIGPGEAIALQRLLAGQVKVQKLSGPVRTVAGTDCAIVPLGPTTGIVGHKQANVLIAAAAVLCDARTMQILATALDIRKCTFPYVPGLLSFREAPAVIAAVNRLPQRPDLLLCDGQGIAHPRRLGLAAHVGLWLDLPTIGVAKSRLCGTHRPVGARRGCHVQLVDHGEVVGSVVRTQDNIQPLYVSPGHRITLEEAVHWTLRCARRYRLAEPNRQAHMLVGEWTRKWRAGMPCSLEAAQLESAGTGPKSSGHKGIT